LPLASHVSVTAQTLDGTVALAVKVALWPGVSVTGPNTVLLPLLTVTPVRVTLPAFCTDPL
jgi:uncharacterized protein (DUF983 family)